MPQIGQNTVVSRRGISVQMQNGNLFKPHNSDISYFTNKWDNHTYIRQGGKTIGIDGKLF